MNILITLGVAAFALGLLWAVQSVALMILGEPLAFPLRYTTTKRVIRWTGQAMIQVSWLVILAGTPLALGIRPLDALQQAFPLPPPWHRIAIVTAITFFGFCFLFALYIKAGWLQIHPRYDPATQRAKLIRRFLGPLPLATLEEAVFRGILLEQLLRSLPQSPAYSAAAIAASSLVFSLVHFIKPPRVIPVGQGIYGFFAAGCLFGLAYVVGGRNLWLPIVMHATAIFCVQMMRLYSFFKGPRYLAGFSEAPQSGLVGSLAMVGMAVALITLI
ncbi:MAG TPA: CPBP family glutamic-type intramembrane protease [Xanthobacteraceae bacterium]|nr:CPBP family glutamic-type intramembrane protease [Xanthobacteraceae bacterium]